MAYNDCNECPHHNQDSCPFMAYTQGQKERFCPSLKLKIQDYNDSRKEPKDCLKCPRRGTSKCAFLNRDYNQKCRCLWVLSEGHTNYNVDLMAQRLSDRLDAIRQMDTPDNATGPQYQEMDYSRNDSRQIVNSMRPFNN